MVQELTIGLIITAALIDSINPCVFGVLIFLLAYMSRTFKSANRMLLGGLIYTSAVYIGYFLLGLGILKVAVSFELATAFYWFAAIVAILAGLLEIKDYFWYGKGLSLQLLPGASERIKLYAEKMSEIETKNPILSLVIAFFLGFFVLFVELPCTGAPYLAILGLIAKGYYDQAIPYLLLYNLIFILPLFIIIGLAYFGTSSKILEKWRKENRGLMRLGMGLFLLALGAYMLWTAMAYVR